MGEETSAFAYWQAQPYDKRLSAIEFLESKLMELNQDFKEFIELLNNHKVKYMVVGGYAVGFHGHHTISQEL
jgi:hypothetical protein